MYFPYSEYRQVNEGRKPKSSLTVDGALITPTGERMEAGTFCLVDNAGLHSLDSMDLTRHPGQHWGQALAVQCKARKVREAPTLLLLKVGTDLIH